MLTLLAGLDVPTSGTVRLAGQDLFALGEDGRAAWRARHLGFVFQNFQLMQHMNALENVMLPLELLGRPRAREAASAMLERVGLGERLKHRPRLLSGGEQQRVALARAFVVEPALMLMDEPFVSLDDPTAQGLRQLLLAMCERRPTTVLFVTHDRLEAVQLGTRILRMSGANATIVQDSEVRLTRTDRTNRDAVLAEHNRIFGST